MRKQLLAMGTALSLSAPAFPAKSAVTTPHAEALNLCQQIAFNTAEQANIREELTFIQYRIKDLADDIVKARNADVSEESLYLLKKALPLYEDMIPFLEDELQQLADKMPQQRPTSCSFRISDNTR